MTSSSQPTHGLVLDLETTDSDPTAPHAEILEIGAIVVRYTTELEDIARASLLIRPPGLQSDHDLIWSKMPKPVQDMHAASGLWAEATHSDDAWSIHDADRAFAEWLIETTGSTDPVPLIGSGVAHLDRPFVHDYMPQTFSRLTYWLVDIGNVRRMLELAGRHDHVDLVGDVDAKPHRALGDAEMHLLEARRYLQLLGTLPALEPAPLEPPARPEPLPNPVG
jgi:oligoribonuclease (3'-5' exoribonuclease)